MSNPFGDFEGDNKTSESQSGRVKRETYQSAKTSNPFGEFEDERDSPPATLPESAHKYSSKKAPLKNNWLGSLEPTLSTSRQSISSNEIETLSFASSTSGIGQWSVGDGQLEKEGLLCPGCLVEFKTITELMHHSEKCFATGGESSSSAGLGTSPNLSSDIPGQMGVQIKDFFNKIRKSGRPSGLSSSLAAGNQAEAQDQVFDTKPYEEYIESVNPMKNWKEQMKIGKLISRKVQTFWLKVSFISPQDLAALTWKAFERFVRLE